LVAQIEEVPSLLKKPFRISQKMVKVSCIYSSNLTVTVAVVFRHLRSLAGAKLQ